MNNEEKLIIEEILDDFIFAVRKGEISLMVFTYYNSGSSTAYKGQRPDCKHLDQAKTFDYLKMQIKDKILTCRNNYWKLNEVKAKFVENFVINNEKEFDTFKEYIEKLWVCDMRAKKMAIEQKEQEEQNKQKEILKNILKDKYDLLGEVIELIIKDKAVYPYKSDKIKIFLELELDIDTIFRIMNTQEKLLVTRGYVEKYFKEKENKKYEISSVIEDIKRKVVRE